MSAAEPDDPELPRTHSPRGPRGAPASAPFTPAARWVAEHQIKVLCMVVATASPILSLWMLARGTANLRQGIWAYSVDGAGTIHYGPVGPADARSALFREIRSEEHTSELQSLRHLVCRLLLEKKKNI